MENWFAKCTLATEEMLGVASAMAGRLELEDLIRSVSSDIRPFLDHDHFDAALLSEDGLATVTFEAGLSTEWGGAEKLVEHSPIRDLLRGKVDHIVSDDAQDDPKFREDGMYSRPIFSAGLRSRLHVSIRIAGGVIGALSFSRSDKRPFGAVDVANARAVSHIIGPYIHGLMKAERAERARRAAMDEAARLEGLRRGAYDLTGAMEKPAPRSGWTFTIKPWPICPASPAPSWISKSYTAAPLSTSNKNSAIA